MLRMLVMVVIVLTLVIEAPVLGVADSGASKETSATASEMSDIVTDDIDVRLSQKITYSAEHKPVRDILDDLSRISGVTLKAGYNNADWQVRDRRMNVFANDIPLLSLMNSMARVMKFRWSKSKEADPPTYRMFMDRKVLLEEEGQRYRQERRLKERQTQKRENVLNELSELDSLSEKEIADLRETRPWTHVLASTGVGQSLNSLFDLAPELRMALAGGEELTTSASALTPAAQQALLQAMQNMWNINSRMDERIGYEGEVRKSPLPQGIADAMGQLTIDVNSGLEPDTALGRLLLGSLKVEYDLPGGRRDYVRVPLMDEDSGYVRSFAGAAADSLETADAPEATAGVSGWSIPISLADLRPLDFGEAIVEHADGPGLDMNVSLEKEGEPISNGDLRLFLSALAESTGFTVVSDSFQTSKMGFPSEEIPLKSLLDALAAVHNYNWWKKGSMVEFRDRHWFKKRSLQIPDKTLENWRKKFKKDGTLNIDDLAEICVLSREQFEMNIGPDEVLGQQMVSVYGRHKEPLRLYARLDAQQRKAVFSDEGLWSGYLSDQQAETAWKLIRRQNPTFMADAGDDGFVLAASYKPEGKQWLYTMRIVEIGEEPGSELVWQILSPLYIEPKDVPDPKLK